MSMSSQARELSAERGISEPSSLAVKKASLALPALAGLVLRCSLPRLPSAMETAASQPGTCNGFCLGPTVGSSSWKNK